MKRTTLNHRSVAGLVIAVAMISLATSAVAQSDYNYDNTFRGPFHQPVSPYPVEMGFSQDHSSTFAEGVQRGRAAVIQALGNYEISESQSEVIREQARALNRENDLKQTEALQAQLKMWSDARIQARKDRDSRLAEGRELLEQRRATIYRHAYQLSPKQLNPATGAIAWPVALQDAKFQENRNRLEELFREHIGYNEHRPETASEIARCVDSWSRTLRNELGSMDRENYLTAQKFLTSLKYTAESVVERA